MSQVGDEVVPGDAVGVMEDVEEVVGDVSPGEAEDAEDVVGAADGVSALEGKCEGEGSGGEKQVPVSEAIRYRKRAQQAERALAQAQERLWALEGELKESSAVIDALERRQKAAALLAEAEAVDMEVATLLTEAAVSQMDEPDVEAAVQELRRRKPYLFRRRAMFGGGGMSARVADDDGDGLDAIAAEASCSGERKDLLRYLRMRRSRA